MSEHQRTDVGAAEFLWVTDDRTAAGAVAGSAATSRQARRQIPGLPAETGLWVFVFGDMTIFGWFFLIFLWEYRGDRDVFASSVGELHRPIGVTNTMILLLGSLLVVLGLHARRGGQHRLAGRWVGAALVCAVAFVVVKVGEYSLEISGGHTPGTNTFFLFYYLLTGLHLLHVIIGGCLLAWWWRRLRAARDFVDERIFAESAAVYWHMVDLLWLVIFTLVYLVSTS